MGLCLGIDFANRKIQEKKNKIIFALAVAALFIAMSTLLFTWSCWYIQEVWSDEPRGEGYSVLELVAMIVWFIVTVLLHVAAWKVSKKMHESGVHGSQIQQRPQTFFGESIRPHSRPFQAKDKEKDGQHPPVILEETGNVSQSQLDLTEEGSDNKVQDDGEFRKMHLVNAVCCDLNCGAAGKETSLPKRCTSYNCFRWTYWSLLMLVSIFFVVVLIGAQKQEKDIRRLLPKVDQYLYADIDAGPVCSYDNNYNQSSTSLRERVEATQRTFPSNEEAILANYTVLHCGPCAACSTFPNLRQQYTTRAVLGQLGVQCAKLLVFGGGEDATTRCNMEKAGFGEECAKCWTRAMSCSAKNCIFIAIRAFMINTVTNLAVGPDDITPATCQEAYCEAPLQQNGMQGFVACSGANRRRMNIESLIPRPGNQKCGILGVPSWGNFFGPSTGHNDFIEDWNGTILE